MNKVMLGLILAVCLLGMLLVMLDERLGRKAPEPRTVAETVVPQPYDPLESPQMPAEVIAAEDAEARSALAPPPAAREEAAAPTAAPAAPEPPAAAPARQVPPPPQPTAAPVPAVASPAPQPAEPASPPAQAAAPTPALQPAPVVQPDTPAQQAPVAQSANPAPQPAQPAASPPPASNTVTRFVVYSREKGATVRIGADKPIKYSSMTLENPNRVVLDLDGQWEFPPDPGIPRNDLVEHVRIGKNGDKTRVVIDLKDKPRQSRVVTSNNGATVDVRVDR